VWGNKPSRAAWLLMLVFSGFMKPPSHPPQASHTFHNAGCSWANALVDAPLFPKPH